MKKFLYLIVLSTITYSCSFDTSSSYWDNKNIKKISKIASKVYVDENKTYDEIKNEFINYGKNSDFPDINN